MRFVVEPSGGEKRGSAPLTLTNIKWYGKDVEQLDTVHSAKVTLQGEDAKNLTPGILLTTLHETI